MFALQGITNNYSIVIHYVDGEDQLHYKYIGGSEPDNWVESEIEYSSDESARPYFKTTEKVTWYLDEFFKL